MEHQVLNSVLNQDMPLAVAAIKTILQVIKSDTSTTYQELITSLSKSCSILKNNNISIMAGCDMALRFINKNSFYGDLDLFKQELIKSLENIIQNCLGFRQKIADHGVKFITEDCTVLVHSYSRVVMGLLKKAALSKNFKVVVTDCHPSGAGKKAVLELRKHGILASLVTDSAIACIMHRIDFVLCGAEGVVQSGGIINQIGTFALAITAKAFDKPFYPCVESYKFVSLFPLDQEDLPIDYQMSFSNEHDSGKIKYSNPKLDYTPPEYISLIITNNGVLTPSGVAEELVLM